MRIATLAFLVLIGCGPGLDPLLGSYPFTLAGTDTNTSPNTNASPASGTGTLAVTSTAAMVGYLVTLAHANANGCTLEATVAEKATAPELTIKAGQTCTFVTSGGTTVATISSGKALLKLNDTRAADVMTLDVSYTYSGSTFLFNQAFSGTGKRTYTGTRR